MKRSISDEIEELISLYGNDVLRTAFLYVHDLSIAEDIFQDVFIKVYKKFSSFNGLSSKKTWLLKITINTAKDYLKNAWNKKVVKFDEIPNISHSENLESNIIQNDSDTFLAQSICALPTNYKDVLILYYFQDFTIKEISTILNVPESTVKTRMRRAKTMLKDCFSKLKEEEVYFYER